ncbi:apolipoprotein D-like isoform X2 [Daphnia pulex]|uniref:apolipoprotein D-like isoform X2 n=1 Tax=Daphnia pulex TaxID=6669 RepID=UPI001EDD9BF4|nr:apolipoprotein D-like isoform X2 [Daphnia pulex]
MSIKAQIAFDVVCPNVNIVQDFDMQKYSGVWFEIESYPDVIDEFDICVSLSYSVQTDGVLQVVSSWFNTSSKAHERIQGSARFVNPGLGAKLLVTYPTSFVTESMSTDGNFWIIETDYKNYAIVFLCLPIGPNISFQFLSYLSRERFPFTMGLNFVHHRIETLGLDRTLLKPIDQTNCPSKAEK